MRVLKTKLIIALALVLSVSACVSDLDVKPIDPNLNTSDKVYVTTDDYKRGLAKLYASFAVSGQQGPAGQPDISGIDEGFSNYLRQYWNAQELTTDEAIIAWDDATIKDFHYQTWTASDVFIGAVYSRIFYTITLCNEFIRVSSAGGDTEITTMNAEARFLRALSYYHAIDLFANVPFITEADEPSSNSASQTNRADLFAYIESELIAIESLMGEPKFEYGRADKGALWMLQAKLYLNAEVFIQEAKYTEAVTALNKVIGASYTLSSNYRQNFVSDNDTSPEVIFSINYDEVNTQSFGGMVYLIHATIGGSMDAPGVSGVNGGWGGIRTTSTFVNKFPDPSGTSDKRALFYTTGQDLEIDDVGRFQDGYAMNKFRNRKLNGDQATTNAPGDFVNTDFVMFRLADAYLMYAEAVERSGTGGSEAQSLTYINQLRGRAFGDGTTPSAAGDITADELTLDFILDERARELYWEGHRRTDLVRFGKFTGDSYLWPWKGKAEDGTSTPAFRNIFPIPSADLGANPNLDQNPGY